jgi:hypothetical protein
MVPFALVGEQPKESQERQLQEDADNLVTTRYFTDCLDQNLPPEECQETIQNQAPAAGGHEVGHAEVKIQVPRNPDALAEIGWRRSP